jgi:hypothetical protein
MGGKQAFLKIFSSIGIYSLICGCANLSNFQTAEVVEGGSSRSTFGVTAAEITTDADPEDLIWEDTYYILEYGARFGLANRVDVGLKFYLNSYVTGIVGDLKFQFVDTKFLDTSIDLGLGVAGIEEMTVFDLSSSLLLTFNFSEKFSITLAPRAINRSLSSTGDEEWETLTGGTFTAAIGDNFKVLPEVGFMRAGGYEYIHYGIGFNYETGSGGLF